MRYRRVANIEHYQMPLELQALDADAGTFRGYASVFNSLVESWIPTLILPGAFTKTLQDHPASAVKVLWMHNMDDPIGACETLTETAIGLEVQGFIVQSSQTDHYMALLRRKVIDALSIGFDPLKWMMEDRGPDLPPLRKIQEVRLWEISLVTFGADPQAKILDVQAVLPYQNLPLADLEHPWEPAEALARVRDWAARQASPQQALRRAFVYADPDLTELSPDHLIADIVGEQLLAVPAALLSAGVAMLRPAQRYHQPEISRLRQHLGHYYAKLRERFAAPELTPPWDFPPDGAAPSLQRYPAALRCQLTAHLLSTQLEQHAGKVLSAKNKQLVEEAIAALNALLAAAAPPDSDDEEEQARTAARLSRLADAELAYMEMHAARHRAA